MASYQRKGVIVSVDERDPTIVYLDRAADTRLVQTDPDTYRLIRGRCELAVITYVREPTRQGWRFEPRACHHGPSRRLHPYPEAALGRRFVVQVVEPLRRITA